jgi:DNA-binding FrmR family transcriptional regulator
MASKRGSYGYRKNALNRRLGRIEGQARGIQRTIDGEKYCIDITQIAAVQATLDRVVLGVLEDHLNGFFKASAATEEGGEQLNELVDVLERFVALRR